MKERYLKRYTTKMVEGMRRNVLLTWTQRQCVLCQRFLSMQQKLHCERCRRKLALEQGYRSCRKFEQTKEGKKYYRLRNYIYNHANQIKVGDIV